MSSNILLAIVGGIIIAGFLGNLLFKVTKIPAVIKLMGIGLLLGPVFQIVDGASLHAVAPLFGKIALLIILFAGGLSLDIRTVIEQLGKAVFLALLAFTITFALVLVVALYVIELEVLQSIILGALIAGTASAIVIPVVTRLTAGEGLITLISIESAISNLLILVIVVIACDLSLEGASSGAGEVILIFLKKIFVSLGSAIVAGALWARLIGSLKEESLSYMLTLGFIFLLNYVVDEELGGSGAISILFFAVVLGNMSRMMQGLRRILKTRFGIKVDDTKYALNEFLKGISGELSFLVGTFFFVFLGVLVSFDDLTLEMGINIGLLVLAILLGRLISLPIFGFITRQRFKGAEILILLSMMPRGLATAVMAFKPAEEQYDIPNVDFFPLYAMTAILGSNFIMTGLVAWGEARLKNERTKNGDSGQVEETTESETIDKLVEMIPLPQVSPEKTMENASTAEEFKTFRERLFFWLEIDDNCFIRLDRQVPSTLKIRHMIFWVMISATAIFGTIGILMGRNEILLAAMFFSPLSLLIHSIASSVIVGDVFMFLKGNVKLIISGLIAISLAALLTSFTPFTGKGEELIRERLEPTILDYILSLVIGLILPVLMLRARRLELVAISPILGLMLFPPWIMMGYGIGAGIKGAIILDGAISFAANFTAMIIGAILASYALGHTKYYAPEYIRNWEHREVEGGVLHKLFERLRLVKILESGGTIYAKFIVIGLLAIAVFVPLQMTINRLGEEYELQTVFEGSANEFFEIEGRSGIVASKYKLKEDAIYASIQIHTDEYFTQEEINSFENALSQRLNKPVKVYLDQHFRANIAEDIVLDQVIEQDLSSRLVALQNELTELGKSLSGIRDLKMKLLGFRSEFIPGKPAPDVIVNYLRSDSLNRDAEILLSRQLSGAMGLPASQFQWEWIPSLYQADSISVSKLSDANGRREIISLLEMYGD